MVTFAVNIVFLILSFFYWNDFQADSWEEDAVNVSAGCSYFMAGFYMGSWFGFDVSCYSHLGKQLHPFGPKPHGVVKAESTLW